MVTGHSYEYMLYRVALRKVRQGKTNFRMQHQEIEHVLHRMGHRSKRRPFRGSRNINSHAIVCVRERHWVVFVKGRETQVARRANPPREAKECPHRAND